MPTAVAIDGAFFLRRFAHSFPELEPKDPDHIALGVRWLAAWHLNHRVSLTRAGEWEWEHEEIEESDRLYRIFFYDCAPLTKKVHYPVSKHALDLSKSETAQFRLALHAKLNRVRKTALRLGRLNEDFIWRPKPEAMKHWLANTSNFKPVDSDFELDVVQKGVDMRLGLDIASMAFKQQVDQIVMVAADADFVPAAKLARREGIDVVLDPMGARAADDLLQHVDGVRSCKLLGRPGEARQAN